MFKFVIDVLFLKRIGLGRPLRSLLLIVALGLVVAGGIYVHVVLKAVQERSQDHNVHAHSSR